VLELQRVGNKHLKKADIIVAEINQKFEIISLCLIYLFLLLLVPGFELRASCLLGRHSTT
jgi:hypothetical protein